MLGLLEMRPVDRSLKQVKVRAEGRTNQQANMRCIKVSKSLHRRQLDVGGSAGQRWRMDALVLCGWEVGRRRMDGDEVIDGERKRIPVVGTEPIWEEGEGKKEKKAWPGDVSIQRPVKRHAIHGTSS